MTDSPRSEYEGVGLRAVRPYLIVSNADEAIDFYRRVFEASELERHTTPAGGVAHAKLQVGESIIEIGVHPDAGNRDVERLPRVGLRLYVTDVDETYCRAIAAGATGDAPEDRQNQGSRAASVYDPFGLTWWLAAPIAQLGGQPVPVSGGTAPVAGTMVSRS
jgi:PhnB protein